MWAGGPPNPMQPRRSHSRAIVRNATCSGWPGSSPPKSLVTAPRPQHFVSQLPQHAFRRFQLSPTLCRCQVYPPSPSSDHLSRRSDEAIRLHLVEDGIQRPRAYSVAVTGQFPGHPCPMHLAVGSVVEDMQSNRASEELAHQLRVVKYRVSISTSNDEVRRHV